jgi:polyisoprenoid-binding protein YceI
MLRSALFPCTVMAALALATASVRAAEYRQAPGSTLTFASRYDGESFTGRFGGFDTKLDFDPARPEAATLEVTIQLAGTTSGNADRDSTLRGADFFNVAAFAHARYSARAFRALGGNRYVADGNLSLRGVTRPVRLAFTWTPGAQPVLDGTATVKRLEFDVGGGDWADTEVLPNDVAVTAHVVFKPAL